MQIRKKFPNEGMNKETKATGKIGLVKTKLIGVKVITLSSSLRILTFTESGN